MLKIFARIFSVGYAVAFPCRMRIVTVTFSQLAMDLNSSQPDFD